MEGFVKIYRQITEHWVWEEKPFSKGQAWIDLIIMANHSDHKFLLGNEIVTALCGQVVTSEQKLMKRWGWSKSKVREFLALLQRDEMITKNTDRKKTTLTLCNYSVFHDSKTTEEPQKDQSETSERPLADPIKNDKNYKNEKNEEITPPISPLEQAILDFKDFRKKVKKPMTDRAVELLRSNLTKLAGENEEMKIAIINQSILNGWQGVFALKEDFKPQSPAPRKPRKGHLVTITNEFGREEEVWKEDE